MPKLTNEDALKKFNDYNDLRRNLLRMTRGDLERYAKGETLRTILGHRFLEKGFRWSKQENRPKLR
jgi:hypothetical protein